MIAAMDDPVGDFIGERRPAYAGETQWWTVRLSVAFHPWTELPPDPLISAVRAVVFKGSKVMVVDDPIDTHVMPGGRREAGETLLQTLEREVMEECGWTVRSPRFFGLFHFRHLTPKQEGYRYPYPAFLHILYVTEAVAYNRAGLLRAGEIETGSRMTPISRAMAALSEEQRTVLAAALQVRGR